MSDYAKQPKRITSNERICKYARLPCKQDRSFTSFSAHQSADIRAGLHEVSSGLVTMMLVPCDKRERREREADDIRAA